jgi:hypothetical protein
MWPITWQTHPLDRENAPRQINRKCLDYNQNLGMSPAGAQHQDDVTERQLQSNSDSSYD